MLHCSKIERGKSGRHQTGADCGRRETTVAGRKNTGARLAESKGNIGRRTRPWDEMVQLENRWKPREQHGPADFFL